MKKIIYFIIALVVIVACKKQEVVPDSLVSAPIIIANDTLVKFTLYSNRIPYIWKRVVKSKWVQDTIKTNAAIKYEPFDSLNFGYGYWVTMNLAGKSTDSLHITGEYKGKTTQMASPKYQSAAYVLLDNL